MDENWLQIPVNRKPTRTLRLCLLLGLACLTLLVAMPGIGASGASAPAPVAATAD